MITPKRAEAEVTGGGLPVLLSETARRHGARTAFVRGEERATWGEVDALSSRCAAALRAHGVRRGDRVALVLDGVVEYLVAYYGILKAGAAVVPVNPDTRTDILAWPLSHTEASAVILEHRNLGYLAECLESLPALRLIVSLGREGARTGDASARRRAVPWPSLMEADGSFEDAGIGPEDPAAIVYTSGTTGRPKGVVLTHGNLLANTRSIVTYLGLTCEDSVAMLLPFCYAYGNSILHTHAAVGGSIVMAGSLTYPAQVVATLERHRCTGLSGVPSTFARLMPVLDGTRHDFTSLRYLTQAGAAMTTALAARIRARLPATRVYIMYGQTEASARLSFLPPEDLDRKAGSIGIAIPGVTLTICDKAGRELPRGETGEVVARGDNVMRGYWRDPEATGRVLRPEGLHTGDLGFMDRDGYIFIVGRESEMIKSGAHRIAPMEIEEVLEHHPAVAQAGVTGVPDELLGEAVAAFVVPRAGLRAEEKALLRHCLEKLPRFKLPKRILVVEALPRTAAGKLQRKELRAWFQRDDAAGSGRHPER